jgi:hypothetical protein
MAAVRTFVKLKIGIFTVLQHRVHRLMLSEQFKTAGLAQNRLGSVVPCWNNFA